MLCTCSVRPAEYQAGMRAPNASKATRPTKSSVRIFRNSIHQKIARRDSRNRTLAIAAATGRFEAEAWRIRKDGSLFWANVVVDAIRDEFGKLVGFAKITRDITEKRNAQEALER